MGVIVALATVGTALGEIANWPLWAILVGVPVAATGIAARHTERTGRALGWGFGTALLLVLGVVGLSIGQGDRSQVQAKPPDRQPPRVTHSRTIKQLSGYAPREIAVEAEEVWVVANEATLLAFDRDSLEELGAPRHFGTHLEHVIACDGHVLVTFDRGMITRVRRVGEHASHAVRYGKPLPAGSRTGIMACGGGSVFVALPLEAKIVRLTLPELRVVETIAVGRSIDGLTYTDGRLYVLDAKQAAAIIVDLTDNLPSGWIVTMPEPWHLVGLGDGTLLISHRDEPCLGSVARGANEEEPACQTSVRNGVRAFGVGPTHAALLDGSGHLHRLDGQTGRADARPLPVPHAAQVSSLAVTDTDHVLLALPGLQQLLDIAPQAWAQPAPAPAGTTVCRVSNAS